MEQGLEKQKYPVGRFQEPPQISKEQIAEWIEVIETFPGKLKAAVQGLKEAELEWLYRPGGWTIRQVINHCADSHINSFIRFKLALTEDTPTIKPYREDLWARLPDGKEASVAYALLLLEGLHARWVILLRNLSAAEWERNFIHPETKEIISLKTNLGIYAWHCEHHLGHVMQAKKSIA